MIGKRFIFLIVFILAFLIPSFSLSEEYGVSFNKGDTIYRIAREHNIPPEIILKINGIKDATKIKPGARIKLPLVYIIIEGDTLSGICKKFKITSESVIKYNGVKDEEKLAVGRKLYLLVDQSFHTQDVAVRVKEENLSWPVTGKREKLSGKLSGAAIYGSQGETIVSVSYGRVVWAGPYRGYGKMIFIKSAKDYIYIYAGNDKILVRVGELVKINTPIGILGASAHDGQVKALFCIYQGKKALDPFTIARE